MKYIFVALAVILIFAAGVTAGFYYVNSEEPSKLLNPLVELGETDPELPLLQYSIENLKQYPFQSRDIQITDVIEEYPEYTAYKFVFNPLGREMSGQINIPKELPEDIKVIAMARGWAPLETYYTGMGTKNAAGVFAQNGYITVAPDFFGYGDSAPEPEDGWLARFEKPMVFVELLRSVEEVGLPISLENTNKLTTSDIGIWAHSNGGQIALTTLEILSEPYPTTLWAPVAAPFPYSVLYFSDEHYDEGKDFRAYVASFEKNYDVFEFSLTQHLDLLNAPFQLHHGTADSAAPIVWSDEFLEKVDSENQRREELGDKIVDLEEELATASAATSSAIKDQISEIKAKNILEPIEYEYFKYPGADHNLVPSWDTAVQRDLTFFAQQL